jgi:cyanophycin synthetase
MHSDNPILAACDNYLSLDGNNLCLFEHGDQQVIASINDIPITLKGAAHHNVANALGVVGFCHAMGYPLAAIKTGLSTFGVNDNIGRCNEFNINGVRIFVDFAHNPDGVDAFISMASRLPGKRRLLLLGQGGDRRDEDIRALARVAVKLPLDKIIIKDLDEYARGRRPGEAAEMLYDEFIAAGFPAAALERIPAELDAVKSALAWSKDGDVLLLLVHEQRQEVLELLTDLRQSTVQIPPICVD